MNMNDKPVDVTDLVGGKRNLDLWIVMDVVKWLCLFLSLRLLKENNSNSVEDSEDCKERISEDKENRSDSKKEASVFECEV